MKLAVVGTGYVGLVAAACLAELGHGVTCVDCDAAKIRRLRDGMIPIYEPGLDQLIHTQTSDGRLTFTTDLAEGIRHATVVFIAVGTPQDEDGSADISAVLTAASDIAVAARHDTVVVLKSTVPVGTNAKVHALTRPLSPHAVSVVSNPEFLKQGSAVTDFLRPDRIVIGSDDERATAIMRDVYAPLTASGARLFVMDSASAELSKYAANAMLAVRISFMNEIANVCEAWGADVDEVRRAVAADSRIGSAFLAAGLGYGGSCFPKDVRALQRFSAEKDYDFKLLRAADDVNGQQPQRFLGKLESHFGRSFENRQIALWGLAFKPDTDDMREAPAVTLIDGLLVRDARVRAYDPQAAQVARRLFGERIAIAGDPLDALMGADALVLATEWSEFQRVDPSQMRALMRQPVVFDGRNVFDPAVMEHHGFVYFSVGRGVRSAPAPSVERFAAASHGLNA